MLLHFTFDTPVNAASGQCGHAIYSDFHVTNQNDTSGFNFTSSSDRTTECGTAPMTAQEKILEYMIWDLASCVPGTPSSPCVKKTCSTSLNTCGVQGDGCGGLIDELRRLRQRPDLRRRRRPPTCAARPTVVQCTPLTCASYPSGIVRCAERRVRRTHDELQQLPQRAGLRCGWGLGCVRGPGCGRVHSAHVRGLSGHLRSAERWVRRAHGRLQSVPHRSDLRRRRDPRRLRRASQRLVCADDVPGADDQLRARGRRLRRRHRELRDVRSAGELRRRRYRGPVRRQRQLQAGDVRGPGHHVRSGARRGAGT